MFNPKQIQQAMKKMGIKSEEVDAEEVVIRCRGRNIVIKEPSVSKIKMGTQETFQVMGKVSEEPAEKFSQDDVKLVTEQTGCSEEEALKALEETGDMAEAIMKLNSR
ncbi:MAG: nascent polypeptide-associated complex protein [archaeon]|nr:MAG: nascent polypeptide-associated complex protein [archaeon]